MLTPTILHLDADQNVTVVEVPDPRRDRLFATRHKSEHKITVVLRELKYGLKEFPLATKAMELDRVFDTLRFLPPENQWPKIKTTVATVNETVIIRQWLGDIPLELLTYDDKFEIYHYAFQFSLGQVTNPYYHVKTNIYLNIQYLAKRDLVLTLMRKVGKGDYQPIRMMQAGTSHRAKFSAPIAEYNPQLRDWLRQMCHSAHLIAEAQVEPLLLALQVLS